MTTADTPRRGRGRPAIGRPLTVRLPDAEHDAVTAIAAEWDAPVAEVVRVAVSEWLAAQRT